MIKVPVIDVFAGPGGLGEGFAAASFGDLRFDVRLSCEVDQVACQTLTLRKFFHLAQEEERNDYYRCITGEITQTELQNKHSKLWREAQSRVMNVELGNSGTRKDLHDRIRSATSGEEFVLVGGPPCQAYSVIGRSRRLGLGTNAVDDFDAGRERRKLARAFYSDPKHRLYREYLEIIALHSPIAFVMENVRGLTSARPTADSESGSMIRQILGDLQDPITALGVDEEFVALSVAYGRTNKAAVRYRLCALTSGGSSNSPELFPEASLSPADFVVRSEEHGIAQTRHRVIIVGVRSDLLVGLGRLLTQPAVGARALLGDMPALRSKVSDRMAGSSDEFASAIKAELHRIPPGEQSELEIPRYLQSLLGRPSKQNKRQGKQASPSAPSDLRKWIVDPKLGAPVQHEARSHMASDLVRYLYCASFAAKHARSPRLTDWPIALRPKHKNVSKRGGKLHSSGFLDRFKVQGIFDCVTKKWAPSSTITSHIAKDGHYYIHYDPAQCRSLTVREAARLQSFPDNYFFCGNRTQQYHQVGNAVPPFLAFQVAELVATMLSSEKKLLQFRLQKSLSSRLALPDDKDLPAVATKSA